MGGSYDIRSYLDRYYDQSVYFHNPADYLRNLVIITTCGCSSTAAAR
jgi:esterase/lipase superfamily enzyme